MTGQFVVTATTGQRVIAAAAVQIVVASPAPEIITRVLSFDNIITLTTSDQYVSTNPQTLPLLRKSRQVCHLVIKNSAYL